MDKDSYLEVNASQLPAIELLKSMGYTYISPQDCELQRGDKYHVLLKDILRTQLRKLNRYTYGGAEKEFSAGNIERAIEDLDEPLTEGLVCSSEKIYDALMLGKSYPEIVGEGHHLSFNLKYIDWEHPENNVFHVTQEFAVDSLDKQHNARPDIVLFLNGIPVGIIECKAPQVPVDAAVEQTVRNQREEYIPQLFKFAQIVMATNVNAVKYATTGTGKKFWNVWKEQDDDFMNAALVQHIVGRTPTTQDRNIISLLSHKRLLELIRYFVLYDANVKKICRYQQYFGIQEIIKTINQNDEHGNRQSGVVWHTQGSGKSLTMVMLAKYILMELSACNPRVVIVTDRKDLDRQITETFAHTRLHPARATSGRHLVSLVNDGRADVITSIINKFNTAERMDVKNESRDVFVLVDESHRSNYGLMAGKMRTVFPNACYIGFTGTPLLKKEKNTMAKFGKLIHKYTIQDGVADGAIVPLIYEGRFVDQNVDEENIDLWFQETTRRLNERQQEDLRQKWSSIRRLTSTNARIKRIALDISRHFEENYLHTGFKAMLATNYKCDAVRYLECFEQISDLHCAAVISPPDMREGYDDTDTVTDDKVIAYWDKMMKQYGDADRYEESIKNQFKAGDIDILIVCSKLLTGFDAPICQVLYIDKELKEHGLLQAIARTNRLCEGKDYGLIVDYRGLLNRLDTAMDMYSGAGLENFDTGDMQGTITDVMNVVGGVREAYSRLIEPFTPIKDKLQDNEAVEVFLQDEKLREDFCNRLCAFGRQLNLLVGAETAWKSIPREELEKYKHDFTHFSKVRRSVKIRYGDVIDNREYEPMMQNLLDTHLSVTGLRQITNPVDILNKDDFDKELEQLGTDCAKADAIVSRMTKSISQKMDENPAYYRSFSERIKKTLDEYRDQVITASQYLHKMNALLEDYRANRSTVTFPDLINGNVHAQAFYGVLSALFDEAGEDLEPDFVAEISLRITEIVAAHSQVDWMHNKTIHDRISQDIDDLFYEYEQDRGLKLDFKLIDKIIENVKTVALRRF